jgi:hypothetical protein
LLLHASHAALPILNSSKLPPVVDAADLFSKLSIKQSEIQNSAVCLGFKGIMEKNTKKAVNLFVNRANNV